jgi:hypothetical protein
VATVRSEVDKVRIAVENDTVASACGGGGGGDDDEHVEHDHSAHSELENSQELTTGQHLQRGSTDDDSRQQIKSQQPPSGCEFNGAISAGTHYNTDCLAAAEGFSGDAIEFDYNSGGVIDTNYDSGDVIELVDDGDDDDCGDPVYLEPRKTWSATSSVQHIATCTGRLDAEYGDVCLEPPNPPPRRKTERGFP